MPGKQRHRGSHPADADLFHPRRWPKLRAAVHDLSWLFTRGYSRTSALKLTGDRYQLTKRQRMAVNRCACADQALRVRRLHETDLAAVRGAHLVVDGYNLLITVESGIAGGVLLRGRDGCVRDLASLHGSYKRVEETGAAIDLLGARLNALEPAHVQWYFDAPVSNSGRLKTRIAARAAEAGWPWTVDVRSNPDKLIASSGAIAVTADSWIIDRAERWVNITPWVLQDVRDHDSIIALDTDT
ncbi:MAG: DUF434 domain-containing protein [Candidatus Hydrogenedentota bacterium]